jgi:hypothetical protein
VKLFFLFFARVIFHALWCRVDPRVTPMSHRHIFATCQDYTNPEFEERRTSLSALLFFGVNCMHKTAVQASERLRIQRACNNSDVEEATDAIARLSARRP